MKHTCNTVADLVQERWESEIPDTVLDALKPLDGKPVTKRLLAKLPGGETEWILERAYGMTHLKNRAYVKTQGNNGISLLLDWKTDAFPLDVREVEKRNPAYFSARKERNHARMEVRHNRELLSKMATILNRIEQAQKEIADAKAEFEELVAYGKPFAQDRHALERACGLRTAEK